MKIYTTCLACEKEMLVSDLHFKSHPNCVEPNDPIRELAKLWIDAIDNDDEDEADKLAAIIDAPARAPRLLDAALAYAAMGWKVFPLQPNAKAPVTRHGFKDATLDANQIRQWWSETPSANVGLPTGSMFDVIDIDPPTGWRSYLLMLDNDALPDAHGVVCTARCGLHLYVKASGLGNRAGMLPGVDYRGAGGYVVAPPSVTDRGPYSWRHKPSPVIVRRAA